MLVWGWGGGGGGGGVSNNMTFISDMFVILHLKLLHIYLCPKMNLIDKVNDIKDIGITMSVSANCNFDQHINNVFKQCSVFQDGF